MESKDNISVPIQAKIDAPDEVVWKKWVTPEDIQKWNNASEDWHTTKAGNDLRAGGEFIYRMEAKDGSFGFDFAGIYDEVKTNQLIEYTIGDGRKVKIYFSSDGENTKMVEIFEAETINPIKMQRAGW
jgi:uncharacterized protein YndB with AHSA1/START domain